MAATCNACELADASWKLGPAGREIMVSSAENPELSEVFF